MVSTYLNPPVALMGAGAVREIGAWTKMFGAKKALIVSGTGKHGQTLNKEIAALLKEAGIDSAVFAGAEPNPTDLSVHEGARMYLKESWRRHRRRRRRAPDGLRQGHRDHRPWAGGS